jgi:hypothetical protein
MNFPHCRLFFIQFARSLARCLTRPFIRSLTSNYYSLVDDSLLGTANNRLLLLLLGNLGGLRLDLTGTSEGSVNLSHFD